MPIALHCALGRVRPIGVSQRKGDDLQQQDFGVLTAFAIVSGLGTRFGGSAGRLYRYPECLLQQAKHPA